MKVTPGLSPWSGRSYFAITASARNAHRKDDPTSPKLARARTCANILAFGRRLVGGEWEAGFDKRGRRHAAYLGGGREESNRDEIPAFELTSVAHVTIRASPAVH